MASAKLEKAIANDSVVVKNVITGEIKLVVGGTEVCLATNQVFDVTKRLKSNGLKSRDALKIPKLADLVKSRHLLLL